MVSVAAQCTALSLLFEFGIDFAFGAALETSAGAGAVADGCSL